MDDDADLPQGDNASRTNQKLGRQNLETSPNRPVARETRDRRSCSGRWPGHDGGSTRVHGAHGAQQPRTPTWWLESSVGETLPLVDGAGIYIPKNLDRHDGSLGSLGSLGSFDSFGSLDSLDVDLFTQKHGHLAGTYDPAPMASWSGKPSVRGATETTRMMLLTCSSLGIAFTWGVEMTYGTPYLLSLGLTKGQASFVWLAGPLSGLIVQPVIGVVSDTSTLKWGRRRPFMIVGSILVACGLLTLGFTREIVAFLFGTPSPPPLLDATAVPLVPTHKKLVIGLAVLALYLTDFAINAVMSCTRSLLVDTLPLTRQQDGAAWASRMASFGHLVGYAAGAVDLVQIFGPALGDTQFKKLSTVAALTILTTSSITCWAVTERVLLRSSLTGHAGDHDGSGPGSWMTALSKIFRQIWSTLITLPPRIQAICWAVFWGWIAWFPFVVYSSTWVGETYFRYDVNADAHSSGDAVGDMGRIGSYALTAYSCATVFAAAVLPLLVRSPFTENASYTRRPPASIARFVDRFEKSRPDLLTVWTVGHIVFACCMVLAPFATSFRFATMIVTLCGLPYTVVSWAPTTFLGVEINRMTESGSGAAAHHRRLSDDRSPTREAMKLENGHHRRSSHFHDSDGPRASAATSGELSGIYFGILNIYMTVPQFIGNLISACVFAVLEPGKSPELAKDAHPSEHHSTDGPNAIGVTFFIGAFFALVSAYATRRLQRL